MSDFLLVDGCSNYNNDESVVHKWDYMSYAHYDNTDPRTPGGGYIYCGGSQSYCVGKAFDPGITEVTMGAAVRFTSLPRTVGGIFQIWGGSVDNPLSLAWFTARGACIQLTLYGNNYSQAIFVDKTDDVILPYSWQYIEIRFKVSLNAAIGEYAVMVDGRDVMEGNAVTQYSGTVTELSDIRLTGGHTGYPLSYTDIYIKQGLHDFYGQTTIETLYPISNGAVTQLTPTPGTADNYECVNSTYLHGSTNYLSGNTGSYDIYEFEDLEDIDEERIHVLVITVAGGTVNGGHRAIRGRTGLLSSSDIEFISGIYTTFYQFFYTTNPLIPGGFRWTPTTINATEFGVHIYG